MKQVNTKCDLCGCVCEEAHVVTIQLAGEEELRKWDVCSRCLAMPVSKSTFKILIAELLKKVGLWR